MSTNTVIVPAEPSWFVVSPVTFCDEDGSNDRVVLNYHAVVAWRIEYESNDREGRTYEEVSPVLVGGGQGDINPVYKRPDGRLIRETIEDVGTFDDEAAVIAYFNERAEMYARIEKEKAAS